MSLSGVKPCEAYQPSTAGRIGVQPTQASTPKLHQALKALKADLLEPLL